MSAVFSQIGVSSVSDLIMGIASIVFFILFAIFMFVFSVFFISLFKKKPKYNNDFTPEVSIIIPVYNEEKNIAKCLDAVVGNDYPHNKIEVIVVDDGSTDNTIEIVRKYILANDKIEKKKDKSAQKDAKKEIKMKEIKIIKQNHLGKVRALNVGVEKSRGEFY